MIRRIWFMFYVWLFGPRKKVSRAMKTRRGLPSTPAATAALAGGAFGLLRRLDSIRRHWLAALALLLLVVIPAGALLVCGWLWLFERVPTITLVCTGVIPAVVGGIYVALRKISAHVI